MASSPYQYIEPTGLIVTDTSGILAEVQLEWQEAFGSDLIVTADTPQGVMIVAETSARANVINNNAALANQINPNYAGGVFLDAIMALTGTQRNAQTPTVVPNVSMTGVPGTLIPANSQARTSVGDIFVSTANVTLDSGGNGTVNFQSLNSGAIPCQIGALSIIAIGVVGWETVNNETVGTLGTTTQSDQQARAYRQNTLGFQGISLPAAITSAIYAVPGVTSLSFLENYYDEPQGMLVQITGGTTLAGQIWGMTTLTGTGTQGTINVDTDPINFAVSQQDLPTPNPWPIAAFSTTGNITLSGLGTQGGGDWAAALTVGNIILASKQTAAAENGLWVAASGSWTRQAYNASGTYLLGANTGLSLKANSYYACVAGGISTAIAAAMLENKSSGCGWNGNTTVALIEPASGQTYNVQLDTPNLVGILVRATVSNGNAGAVQQAILDYAAGNITGLAGFVVGANVSPFELAGAIMAENPGTYVQNVEISLTTTVSYSNSPINMGQNQQAQTQLSYITVIVNP